MNIRCTARLLKELGVKPENLSDQPAGLYDWHANLLRLDRKKHVLFTNDQTLYSFLVRWTKASKTTGFLERFRLGLFKSMMSERIAEDRIEYFLSKHTQSTITKTNNRSVLGSMNDYTFQVKFMVYRNGGLTEADLPEISRQINQTPMGAIKYKSGIDELKRRLDDACE